MDILDLSEHKPSAVLPGFYAKSLNWHKVCEGYVNSIKIKFKCIWYMEFYSISYKKIICCAVFQLVCFKPPNHERSGPYTSVNLWNNNCDKLLRVLVHHWELQLYVWSRMPVPIYAELLRLPAELLHFGEALYQEQAKWNSEKSEKNDLQCDKTHGPYYWMTANRSWRV